MDGMARIMGIENPRDIENSVKVIRQSFQTVADEFGLNKSNCPAHPSLITLEKLLELKNKAELLGLFLDEKQVGFVAVEKGAGRTYYLDKLAVLPDFRHHGYGRKW